MRDDVTEFKGLNLISSICSQSKYLNQIYNQALWPKFPKNIAEMEKEDIKQFVSKATCLSAYRGPRYIAKFGSFAKCSEFLSYYAGQIEIADQTGSTDHYLN